MLRFRQMKTLQKLASVHVGPDAVFAPELPAFSRYLERVSSLLRLGRAESRLALYLPNEDNRHLDRIPDAERTPGAPPSGPATSAS